LTVRIAGPLRGAHCSYAHHRWGISAPARRVKPAPARRATRPVLRCTV